MSGWNNPTADLRQKPVSCPICGQKLMVNEGFYYECTVQGCEGRVRARRKEDRDAFEAKLKAEEKAEEDSKLNKAQQDWA